MFDDYLASFPKSQLSRKSEEPARNQTAVNIEEAKDEEYSHDELGIIKNDLDSSAEQKEDGVAEQNKLQSLAALSNDEYAN